MIVWLFLKLKAIEEMLQFAQIGENRGYLTAHPISNKYQRHVNSLIYVF